ncbi:MAG: hypothetical protein MI748_08680 [Opitutales bacterium]|nr:hypothetical protein [Opitutales bacterium]
MPNLNDYYTDLLNWEGVAPTPLVRAWPAQLRQSVEADIVSAVVESGVKGTNCPIRPRSTNQSIGNQVENYTIPLLQQHTSAFIMGPCSGAGYPDKTLTERSTRLKMPLEVKATSDWNPADSNRRVLTSSSTKLRNQFTAPIHHLLLTVLYTPATSHATIDAIRLDFLEPSTSVSVRLEASVNHKILSNGPHHSKVI